jgi:hypothetical protein
MADQIFQKAWGHYISLLDALSNAGASSVQGVIQPYNLATLLPYSQSAPNYNLFLLTRASNYVAPTLPIADVSGRFDDPRGAHASVLDQAYEFFLYELDEILLQAIDASKKDKYKEYNNELKAARTDLQNFDTKVADNWQIYLDRNPDIPAEELEARRIIWERERGYSGERKRYIQSIARANARINAFLRQNSPKELWKIIDAKAYFEDPGYSVDLPVSAQFDKPSSKHLWRSFHIQLPELDLEEFLTNDNVVSRTFSTESEDYSRVETNWNVKAKAKWGIYSGGGNVERRELEEISKNSHFEFEVGFSRFEEVPIFRDSWYQDILFTTIGERFRDYWGPNGNLASIPYSLLIARGTKINVKMGDEYRRKHEKFISSGGSFGIGSFFSIGGGYTKDEKYMQYRKNSEGFSLEDSDKTVRILGARVVRFNWDNNEIERYYAPLAKEEISSYEKYLV